MKATTLKRSFQSLNGVLKRYSPAILTGIGVAGVITTAIMAAKATSNAMYALDEADCNTEEELTKKDVVKIVAPYYIPTLIMGATTIGCILGLNSIHTRRTAAIASLYSLTEASLKEYEDRVLKELGPKRSQKIRDDMAQEKLDKNPTKSNTIFETGSGDSLCYDALSGRYFRSSIESIKRAMNDFNYKLINHAVLWMSVNEFYYELNLQPIKLGDLLGWNTEKLLDIRFASKLTDKGDPCLVLDYAVEPRFLYN
ncbi:MAG: hypothetical protein GX838_07030 [Clostridiaceae bacterium]|nr:hypothetical protein [Clostridiaceae bacterium]